VLGEKKDWVDVAQGWELRDLGMAEKMEEVAAQQGGASEAAAAAVA
jgi:hypothetical protein